MFPVITVTFLSLTLRRVNRLHNQKSIQNIWQSMASAALKELKSAMDGVIKGTAGADTEGVLTQVHDTPLTSTAALYVLKYASEWEQEREERRGGEGEGEGEG
jgi:hypothetical protein